MIIRALEMFKTQLIDNILTPDFDKKLSKDAFVWPCIVMNESVMRKVNPGIEYLIFMSNK